MLTQFGPVIKAVPGNFQRIGLVCFDTAQGVLPILLDQQRVDRTDKNPGVVKHLSNWQAIL